MILGLLGNDRLGRCLASPPFRLLGRLSCPVYLSHFPLLCSVACALFVMLQPMVSRRATLLLVAAIYAPVMIGFAYLCARVDEARLRWVTGSLCDWSAEDQPQALPRRVNAFTVPSAIWNVVSQTRLITCGGKPPPYHPL